MVQLTFKRYEIKYLLTNEQRDRLRILMGQHMVPDEWGPSTVCNVYYDTPSSLLIRRSLEKPVYKEKVRIRSYGPLKQGSPVFLELKKKSEGVVYKRRATMDPARAAQFLRGEGDPQNKAAIKQMLREAGVIVADSNYESARLCARVCRKLEG